MGRIASFHLVSEPSWKTPLVLARLGVDRVRSPRVAGLAFWRLLGTGRGDDTGRGADLSRSALFAVWEGERDLDTFLDDHTSATLAECRRELARPTPNRRRARDVEGVDPLAGLDQGSGDGPVAIITRANVRRRSWKAFGAASEVVDAELHRAPGLIEVVGIGETPIGSLATFSLWESLRRSTGLRVLDARPSRGDPSHPRRGLVCRGDVRSLRAICLDRRLERPQSPCDATAGFPS